MNSSLPDQLQWMDQSDGASAGIYSAFSSANFAWERLEKGGGILFGVCFFYNVKSLEDLLEASSWHAGLCQLLKSLQRNFSLLVKLQSSWGGPRPLNLNECYDYLKF